VRFLGASTFSVLAQRRKTTTVPAFPAVSTVGIQINAFALATYIGIGETDTNTGFTLLSLTAALFALAAVVRVRLQIDALIDAQTLSRISTAAGSIDAYLRFETDFSTNPTIVSVGLSVDANVVTASTLAGFNVATRRRYGGFNLAGIVIRFGFRIGRCLGTYGSRIHGVTNRAPCCSEHK
jgi:hypothetical protein